MNTSVTLDNWRTPPYSAHAFHNVDKLIPAVPIKASHSGWAFSIARHSLEGFTFHDHLGKERQFTDVLASTDTRGLVVLHQGRMVMEWYGGGYDGTRPHIIFSVSKSLTGAMAGILVDSGQLDPDSLVATYIPEVEGSAYGDCLVRHVLDMTVSSSFVEEYVDLSGEYGRYRRATLWSPPLPGEEPETMHDMLATLSRGSAPHGQVFKYLSPNSDLLGWLIERASGKEFTGLFSDLIWKPMGAESDAYITVDAERSPRTAGGICVLPRDLARFGEMMRLGGKGILPSWWIEDIRSNGDSTAWQKGDFANLFPDGRYRSKWYQSGFASGAFCAIGIHGQWLWIDPKREVVIAKVSNQSDPENDDIDLMLIQSFEAIAKAVS